MSDELFVLLKGLMVFGLPLAWGVRELVLLKRDRERRERDEGGEAPCPVSPVSGGEVVGEVVAPPVVARVRETELA